VRGGQRDARGPVNEGGGSVTREGQGSLIIVKLRNSTIFKSQMWTYIWKDGTLPTCS